MFLVFTLIICAHSLKDKYKTQAVTKVELEWDQFDKKRQSIKPIQKAGFYAFYQIIGDEYVKLIGEAGQDKYLTYGQTAVGRLNKDFASENALIVCIGKPDGQVELIRTQPQTLRDYTWLILLSVVLLLVLVLVDLVGL